jgi:hypothetical protein
MARGRAHDTTPSALLRRLVIEGLDRVADTASRIAETREDIGPDDWDKVVVLTKQQLTRLMEETARFTAERVLSKLGAEIAQSIKDELRRSTAS